MAEITRIQIQRPIYIVILLYLRTSLLSYIKNNKACNVNVTSMSIDSKNRVGRLEVLQLVLKWLGIINKEFFGPTITEIITVHFTFFPL
jgi:hypothetical protein